MSWQTARFIVCCGLPDFHEYKRLSGLGLYRTLGNGGYVPSRRQLQFQSSEQSRSEYARRISRTTRILDDDADGHGPGLFIHLLPYVGDRSWKGRARCRRSANDCPDPRLDLRKVPLVSDCLYPDDGEVCYQKQL